MDKALTIGKLSTTGSFQLFVGKVISTITLAIGSIILGNVLSPSEYGLYAIALIPSQTICLFANWGIRPALVKYVAKYKSLNKETDAREIIITGLTFQIIIGLFLTFISLIFSDYIATVVLNRPGSTDLILITSVTIISQSLLLASRSVFTGLEKMKLSSFTFICQSVLQTSMVIVLVILGYGTLGAVVGYSSSILIASIVGFALVYFQFIRRIKSSPCDHTNKIKTIKKLLGYGVPISLSNLLTQSRVYFYSFLMAFYCSDVLVGNFQVAVNFSQFLAFITFPVGTVLLPAFSKLDPKSELSIIRSLFSSAVKYTSLFLVPATMATVVLSELMVNTLYGEKWLFAPFYLSLYVLSNLFVLFGSQIINNFFAGIGETKTLLKINIIEVSVSICLSFILIPTYGIIGVIIGPMVGMVPSMLIGLILVWKRYNAKVNLKSSSKIFFSSIISSLLTFLVVNSVVLPNWVELIVGGVIFVLSYFLLVPLIGAVTKSDLLNLKTMFSGLGPISKLLNLFLSFLELIASLFKG